MAHITKRGEFQWQAQVRRKGFKPQTKTFERRKDADAWAKSVETQMTTGTFVSRNELERTTLFDALERYLNEVTPTKKSAPQERNRILKLQKHPLAFRTLASLQSKDFSAFRDERKKLVQNNTVRLELAIFSHLFTVARKDWSLPMANLIQEITNLKASKGRNRRLRTHRVDGLERNEEQDLIAAAKSSLAKNMETCIRLAIETGMRAGELVSLEWSQIDFAESVIHLTDTKNGDDRDVPLSLEAERVLRSIPRPLFDSRLTEFYNSAGLSRAFARVCDRAGIVGLRFHDLRHEAASRFAPRMPATTLAKVMGWKTIQMAMRYYNATAKELVAAVRKDVLAA